MVQGQLAVHLPHVYLSRRLACLACLCVQGQSVTLQWATVGWPAGPSRPLTITLWSETDCVDGSNQGQQKPADQVRSRITSICRDEIRPSMRMPTSATYPLVQALAVLARDAALNPPGRLDWVVPLSADGPAALAAAVAAADAAAAAGGGRRRVPRFFISISDGVSTNYSEPFDIRLPYTYVAGECRTHA